MDETKRQLMLGGLAGAASLSAASLFAGKASAAPAADAALGLPLARFGIDADSGRDESERLLTAIKAAAATRQPLLFPAGDVLISKLELRGEPVHLIGIAGASHLRLTGGKGIIALDAGGDSVRLTGLSLSRSGPRMKADAGLLAINDSRVHISNCAFSETGGPALALAASSGEIVHCRFSELGADAVRLASCDAVTIAGNRFEVISGAALAASACQRLVISHNRGTRFSATAFDLVDSIASLVSANHIDEATGGIAIGGGDKGGRLSVIADNLIRGITAPGAGGGAGISVEMDAQVSGNLIEGALFGILIGRGKQQRDVNCTGNTIRNANIGIAVSGDFDAGYVAISGNFISGSKDGAIRAMDGSKPIGPDLSRKSAESYRSLSIFGNAAP